MLALLEVEIEITIPTHYCCLQDTGLGDTLKEEGPFTVLAPSDHIFRALPQIELQHLLENQDLQETLIKQHVLKGKNSCCKVSIIQEERYTMSALRAMLSI